MKGYIRPIIMIAIVLGIAALLMKFFQVPSVWPFGSQPKKITLSTFKEQIASQVTPDGKQAPIIVSGEFDKDRFKGKYAETMPAPDKGREFYVIVPPESSPARAELYTLLDEYLVKYEIVPTGFGDYAMSILVSLLLPLGVIVVFWLVFLRQAQSGGNQALNFGRSRHRRLGENVPKVTFDDVAGVEEAKQDLQEIVEFLKNAKKFQALGAKIPKGVLLLGPPGSGKTLLARAIAGEAGVPFFHISGSDFVEMFVGVGASRVRDLFDTAKQNRPALIFIDEIDAVGRQRGAGWGGGHDEREQTLNQLLVEMDGFDPNSGVILIAATNRPDVLDPALLRPGRFDRRVVVDAPDQNGRKAILGVHTKGKPIADDVDLENLARRTPGFSGADLANLVNEAALLAARRDKTRVEMNDFEEAIDRHLMGPARKSRIMTEAVKRRTAYHEAGHAIVGELLVNSDPTYKVTILPRGMALGVRIGLPTEDRFSMTKDQMEDRIAVALAGRIAEMMIYGNLDTGAASDLDHVSDIARAMVCEYGMSERLGNLRLGRRSGSPFLGRDGMMQERDYSEEIARIIDEEIRAIVDHNYKRAEEVLQTNRHILERVTDTLMEKETLDRAEFLRLLQDAIPPEKGGRKPEPPSSPSDPPAAPTTDGAATENDVQGSKRPIPRPRLEPGMA